MAKRVRNKMAEDFDALQIVLASEADILDWSYGEVVEAETINYRTLKAEPGGLFCEKIFGPTQDYHCYCGKYKKIRYKGIVCDKCGVEITRKSVRRERMGHIKLAVPVAHVWFSYGIPDKISLILGVAHKKLISVIYYARYIVTSVEFGRRTEILAKISELKENIEKEIEDALNRKIAQKTKEYEKKLEKGSEVKKDSEKENDFKQFKSQKEYKQEVAGLRFEYAVKEEREMEYMDKLEKIVSKLSVGMTLKEEEYIELEDKGLLFFEVGIGAPAIKTLLEQVDLEQKAKELRHEADTTSGTKKRLKLIRRLKYVEGFLRNGLEPAWMVTSVIPVLPPALRPIISLPGGRFATHDLNDLYRRVIHRNNRLKELMEIDAPEVILRNEKRMLQESVDALIDNEHRPGRPVVNRRGLPYKSLADQLRGKKGIFRKNLLGKRVDYSGRAVIVGDAKLKIDKCGLPKSVALEIFKPFVIGLLLQRELAANVKIAKEIVFEKQDIVWDLLEEVITDRLVLLNRAPTLHKYSVQAFYPVLVEGEAIRLHPLVCKAFNADFDGDQMAVHVLLTAEAQKEGVDHMLSTKNIKSIASGKLLAVPSKDMVLGLYLLTELKATKDKKKIKKFATFNAAISAFHQDHLTISEEIIVRNNGEIYNTSVGRVIFNSIFPEGYKFINRQLSGSDVSDIIENVSENYDEAVLLELLDELKRLGFKYATDLGFSFAIEDCNISLDVDSKVSEVEKQDEKLQENYMEGLITMDEKVKLVVNTWNDFADKVAEDAWNVLDRNNPVYEMVESGANGGKIQARQVLTIKGVIRDSEGNWIPMPIKGNYRDGLDAFEYFVAANGGRKGIVDRSLRTSSSGYLTRKLVDVAHSVIIREKDCGYDGKGICISSKDERRISFEHRLFGRVVIEDIKAPGGNVIVAQGNMITRLDAKRIVKEGITDVFVRSPIYCKSPVGICQYCYGGNMETGKLAKVGLAAGVIAAQSLGEPGTQMTMRTFQKGGVARTDITQGIPRIEQLFEARIPKFEAEIATFDGKLTVEIQEDGSTTIVNSGTKKMDSYYVISKVKEIFIKDGDKVEKGETLFIMDDGQERQAPYDCTVNIGYGILHITGSVKAKETFSIMTGVEVLVEDGQEVKAGDILTEGAVDPVRLARTVDVGTAQKYVIDEAQKVFAYHGLSIADVHFEVIVRQMGRLGQVMEAGDTDYLVGSFVNKFIADAKNKVLKENNGRVSLIVPKLFGIKKSALQTENLLSAISFQEVVRVLTSASILGKRDYLRGMKENVIIGRRIPTGESARIKDSSKIAEVIDDRTE